MVNQKISLTSSLDLRSAMFDSVYPARTVSVESLIEVREVPRRLQVVLDRSSCRGCQLAAADRIDHDGDGLPVWHHDGAAWYPSERGGH
jgi:hypothetical protein